MIVLIFGAKRTDILRDTIHLLGPSRLNLVRWNTLSLNAQISSCRKTLAVFSDGTREEKEDNWREMPI